MTYCFSFEISFLSKSETKYDKRSSSSPFRILEKISNKKARRRYNQKANQNCKASKYRDDYSLNKRKQKSKQAAGSKTRLKRNYRSTSMSVPMLIAISLFGLAFSRSSLLMRAMGMLFPTTQLFWSGTTVRSGDRSEARSTSNPSN